MDDPTGADPDSPLPGRRERKRQQTADHLADTAWALFVEQGFEQVTMEAIAAAADVAKGTLYKHFPVKEALLRHRFHRELADEMPALRVALGGLASAEAGLRAFLARSAAWSESRRPFLRHYLHFRLNEAGTAGGMAPERRSGLDGIFARLIALGQERGEFSAAIPAQQLGEYFQFLYLACLMRWVYIPGLDLEAEFNTMLALFINGVRSGAASAAAGG